MNKTTTHRFTKRLHLLVMATLLAVALGVPPLTQAAPAARVGPALDEGQGPTELLQFTAAGHVLGFQPQGVYVVGSDHMVKVEFADTAGVAPVADQPPSSHSQSQPLGRVSYPHLWEGITLSYERVADGIARSSFLLDPGADVGRIKLRYNVPLELDGGGNLVIALPAGQMKETAPLAWQEINGQRVPVEVAFRLLDGAIANRQSEIANPLVGFAVGEYDPTYALMIDPTLQWHTFLGGTGDDYGYGIAVDGSGNVYVGGTSGATWQGTNPPVRPHQGVYNYDAFAAKLNASGQLVWNTFLGGTGDDDGPAIAVDACRNVYVGGYSTATWGGGECAGCPVRGYTTSYSDAFAAKISQEFTLTVNKDGTGTGTVPSAPAGIHCGADCTEIYNGCTVVTLTAHPGVKSYFVGWSGDCAGTEHSTDVTMDADKHCIATFGYPVGGIVVPVSKLGLVAPWMGLVTLAGLAGLGVALVRRCIKDLTKP